MSLNSFGSRKSLELDNLRYTYFDINVLIDHGVRDVDRLPVSLKVLLENLCRYEDGKSVTKDHIESLSNWVDGPPQSAEITFRPARVLMQDFTGVPAVADLAAMRSAVDSAGLDPTIINPQIPVDLVIDHSVMVDHFGSSTAFERNVRIEMERNQERYRFLKWGQQAFEHFRVVPPGTGICHQVNLEYLANVVWTSERGREVIVYPDTLVGTDSHTTMINGLGVLGWGVGGIEAEAAMLGQPISMLIPEVIGVRMTGELGEGITATDLVLRVVEILREHGVVGKFVEFFGPSLDQLPLADRATIANMAPEYGATCGFFPIDNETLKYLKLSSRSPQTINLVEAYAKIQGLWRNDQLEPVFTETLHLDLSLIEPSLAGPKRPQDRVPVKSLKTAFDMVLDELPESQKIKLVPVSGTDYALTHGSVVIAAITSCTNTSNPAVMLAAGLVARNAEEKGLSVKPWVKTSLAPGSKVVTEYLNQTGLQKSLDAIGFNLVGFGCTTCIGNSGPLPEMISKSIAEGALIVSSVLSGNRNFEGRVHQEVRTNWLASPPLVVAYALAGTTRVDLTSEPLGTGKDGEEVYLRDIWPTNQQVQAIMDQVSADMFSRQYADVFHGTEAWQELDVDSKSTYDWEHSTYIAQPPFFDVNKSEKLPAEILGARLLAVLGDSITTDHISPAGAIQPASPAGEYLQQLGVSPSEFNSYGSRRGNHDVMVRGTLANIRIRNEIIEGVEGGYTIHIPTGDQLSIYDAAIRYRDEATPLVIIAGKEYGTGSSRDWAAKGTRLLGVQAVIAESFERIHRSNLIGMGVLPLQFKTDCSRTSLRLSGRELIDIYLPKGIEALMPQQEMMMDIHRESGAIESILVDSRINTENELEYFRSGGILQYVLNNMIREHAV